jgi:DNA repair exonuclease SbcCD ATPase subunit
MWSEHCSYKSSKVHLRQFGTKVPKNDSMLVGIGANAGVKLRVGHAGRICDITRNLRPSGHILSIDNVEITSSFRATNEYIAGWLNATRKQLSDYIFVAQGKMDSLFSKTAEQRTLEMATLFGVAQTEQIWETIGNRLSRVDIQLPMPADNLRQRITELNTRIATHTARSAYLSDCLGPNYSALAECETAINNYRQRTAVLQQHDNCLNELTGAQNNYNQIT